jgi:hypothetical protein
MNAKAVLIAASRKVGAGLKNRGYQRRALTYVMESDGVVSMIELQPARGATPEQLSFVINFGVIVRSLVPGDDLTKPEYGGCHWGGRVSDEGGVEIWWPVRADDDVAPLAARLLATLEQAVLPALEANRREEDLVALWKTGRCPLLVDSQRLLFLATLLHRAGRRDEFEQTKAELERKAADPFSLRALGKLRELDS